MSKKWGVYNTVLKRFQFGISADSIRQADEELFRLIGKRAYMWRYDIRLLPEYRDCQVCNKQYLVTNDAQKYCSKECRDIQYQNNKIKESGEVK